MSAFMVDQRNHMVQTEPSTANALGGGSHVTTSGSVVSSSDPTTNPNASLGEKLKGDFRGAINGTIGSIEGMAGALFRHKQLEAKGIAKMQEEDQRLGAKNGVMPVGSHSRNTTTDATSAVADVPR